MSNRLIAVFAVIVMLIGLAACSGNTNNNAQSAGIADNQDAIAENENKETQEETLVVDSEDSEEKTRAYTDLFGEVTVPTQPKKLLVTNTRYAEYLISLGVNPQVILYVPLIEPEYRADFFTSHGAELIEYPQYEHNFELLLTLEADMIVAPGVGMEESVYEQLSKIAPTVAINAGPSMDESMPLLAELFGKEAEYEAVMAAFNAEVEEAKKVLIEAVGEDRTVLVLRVEPKQYRFLGQHAAAGSSQLLYQQLGLKIPDKLADAEAWFTALSLEILPEIDPDYIFVERRIVEGADSTESWNQLMESNVWKSLKAVQAGSVFPLLTNDFVQGEGPVGYTYLIDYIVSSIVSVSNVE
jgi:iron complex transport system substrate-binding protein